MATESNVDATLEAKRAHIPRIGQSLASTSTPLAQRFRDIFTLKSLGGRAAIDALVAGLQDESALLKHEIAYSLGQLQDPYAIPALVEVLKNKDEDSMVRHEAGEALGAIGDMSVLPVLEEFAKDEKKEVAETCIISIDRLKFYQDNKEKLESSLLYTSVDPAPPLSVPMTDADVPKLKAALLDTSKPLFKRYRAMFALRNIGGKDAVDALCAGFDDESALFRHEIAYVLGQMSEPCSAEALKEVLKRDNEHGMVRHEAAEALGSIAECDTLPILQQYSNDQQRVVAESCQIALDIHAYYTSDEFEYANSLVTSN